VLDESWPGNAYHVAPEMLRGKVVVDIGANIGAFSLLAVGHGARAIHAYEPDEDSRRMLVENVARNNATSTVTIHPEAVGPSAGTVRFNGGHSGASHINRPGDVGYDVPMVSLATAIERAGGHVDFLKVDCEGGEYRILLGDTDPFDITTIDRIGLEFHNQEWGEPVDATTRVGALVTFLLDHGTLQAHGHPSKGGMIYWQRYGVG
jgi:FkbM family methyltransferase